MNHYVDLEFHAAVVGPGRAVVQLQVRQRCLRTSSVIFCISHVLFYGCACANSAKRVLAFREGVLFPLYFECGALMSEG